jgi:LPXTG-motif cell wall-anchored protein
VVDNGDGTFDYTPDAGWSGTDTFDYTISDGHGGTDTATVTLTVDKVQPAVVSPPQANDDAVTMPKHGRRSTIDVLGNDTEGSAGPVTVTIVTGPRHGTATVNPDGTISYEQTENGRADVLTYRICAAQDSCSTAQVRLVLRPMVAGRSANRSQPSTHAQPAAQQPRAAAPARTVHGEAQLPSTGASTWTTAAVASGLGLLAAGAALLLVARHQRRRVRS